MNIHAQQLQRQAAPGPLSVVAITSGKGGVGKTSVAVNLAVSLARQGRQVMLFDADLGLANVDIALGLKPRFDVSHVLSGERSLDEIMLPGPAGIHVIPAASGIAAMASLDRPAQAGLVHAFSELSLPLDTLLVDTAAGIDTPVLTFASACQEIVVVICDEPTSLTDAYALVKVLNQECGVRRFRVLANMVRDNSQGTRLFERLCGVADRFLNVHLSYLGAVPQDEYLRKAVRARRALVCEYPRSAAARALGEIATRLAHDTAEDSAPGGVGFFMERLFAGAAG